MKKEFITYLEEEKCGCLSRGQEMLRDDRKDEADLCKIEANIYEIFGTLYQTACKQVQDDKEEEIAVKFLDLARKIPMNWRKSYDAAKIHGDNVKVVIEEIKLNVADRIVNEYRRQIGD